jgi:hypothetical protein
MRAGLGAPKNVPLSEEFARAGFEPRLALLGVDYQAVFFGPSPREKPYKVAPHLAQTRRMGKTERKSVPDRSAEVFALPRWVMAALPAFPAFPLNVSTPRSIWYRPGNGNR